MKKLLLLLLVLCMGTGCHKQEQNREQHLRINFQEGDLPSLHPHDLVIYLRGLSLSKHLYENLTRINAEGGVDLAGAESVHLSQDQLTYTFVLRDHLWSNGKPVTAFHYEQAWKSLLSPDSTCSRADLFYGIKNGEGAKKGEVPLSEVGIKAIDEKTLVVELAFPSPHFLELLAESIAAPLFDCDNKEQSVFNGPFIVNEWKKGNFLRLTANPFYWNHPQIALQTITIYFIEDANTVLSLFEKKEIDWIGVPLSPLSSEFIHRLKEKNNLKSFAIGRSFWVFINTQIPSLASSKIRQALSMAINRAEITKHILIGAEPSKKPLSSQLLSINPKHLIDEDPQAAQEVFKEGMKELGYDQHTYPTLEISYSQQANRKQLAEYLQERWTKTLGIEVKLKSVEWNVLRSNLEKGLFTISMAYEGAFYQDPLELLERYSRENPSNFSQWIHADFAQTLALAKQEKTGEKRVQLLSDAEEILIEEMPFIPICSDRLLFSHHPHLRGHVIDSIGAIDFSYATLEPSS